VLTRPADLLPLAGRLRALFAAADFTVDGVADRLGPVASGALGRDDLVPALAVVDRPDRLDALIRLFLLAQDEPAAAAAFLPEAVLEPAGPGQVRAALDLRPHEDDWWVASDLAHQHPPVPDHVIGIGSASLTLLEATVRRPVARALDIGTGCGVQALHLGRFAERVTATDAVARAVDMARLSFALSGLAPDAVELVVGEWFEPVAGREFDLVVSNPPFVLAPVDADGLRYRDAAGGDDSGLGRLLRAAAKALAPNGVAQFLTSWIVPTGGDWTTRVEAMLPPGCDALVLLREQLDPAEHVALWRDADEPEPGRTQRALRWLAHLDGLRADAVAYGLVVLRRTDAEPRIRLRDLTAEPRTPDGERIGGWLDRTALLRDPQALGALRLQPGPGIRLGENSVPGAEGWEVRERWLSSTAALPETVAVDPVTTALLSGASAALPLAAVAELLAVATGAPAEGVLRVGAELLETGHLVPAVSAG
jgi:methylase of polypeptide subunit release factors